VFSLQETMFRILSSFLKRGVCGVQGIADCMMIIFMRKLALCVHFSSTKLYSSSIILCIFTDSSTNQALYLKTYNM
jgi:uncharacterized membrane protein (DUF373 family)